MTKPTAQTILEQIRRRHSADPYDIMKVVNPPPEEIKIAKTRLSADTWQDFKRRWIEEYGGEKVQADGLTHSEFLTYFGHGRRENDEFTERSRLEDILRKLDNENPPV